MRDSESTTNPPTPPLPLKEQGLRAETATSNITNMLGISSSAYCLPHTSTIPSIRSRKRRTSSRRLPFIICRRTNHCGSQTIRVMQARDRADDLEARSTGRVVRVCTEWKFDTHNNNMHVRAKARSSTAEGHSSLSIYGLPTKLLEEIVHALGASPVHLTRCMGVSREWRGIAGSDSMWQRICTSRWPSIQMSPATMAAAGGARAFFRQRQMTIALLDAHSHTTVDELAARVLASNARAAADYLWMIDLVHADGTVLFSQVIEPDPVNWVNTFPVVTETTLTDAKGQGVQFETVASMVDGLLVSINVVRRSDNKMLCVANNQRLRQQIVDSENESDWEEHLSCSSEAAVATVDVISVDCPINSELTFDHLGKPLLNTNATHEEQPRMVARLELDGTDPASKGQVTVALILLSEGDYVEMAEFVETMKAVLWL